MINSMGNAGVPSNNTSIIHVQYTPNIVCARYDYSWIRCTVTDKSICTPLSK